MPPPPRRAALLLLLLTALVLSNSGCGSAALTAGQLLARLRGRVEPPAPYVYNRMRRGDSCKVKGVIGQPVVKEIAGAVAGELRS